MVEGVQAGMKYNNPIWRHVTPVPPEMNGNGFLWECRKCGQVLTCGKEPMILCPNCERKRREAKNG